MISILITSKSALTQSKRKDIFENNLYLGCSNVNSNFQSIIFLSDTAYGDDVSYGYAYDLALNDPFSLNDSSIEPLIKATNKLSFNYALNDVSARAVHYIGSKAYKANFENITLYQFVDGTREFRKDYWQPYASINRFTGQYQDSSCKPINLKDFNARYVQWRKNLEARFEQIKSKLLF
jgi:hypothetical protein